MTIKEISFNNPENNSYASLILEKSPDALVIINEDGEIVFVNGQAENMFGYMKSELLGQKIETLMPECYRAAHEKNRTAYLKKPTIRTMGFGLRLYALHKNGNEIPVDISLSPIKTSAGLTVLAAIRDITERKALEEIIQNQRQEIFEEEARNWHIREINMIKDELLDNMSHELRTPLNGIIGFTEIFLTEKSNLTPEQEEYLNIIMSNAKHLTELIGDILSLTAVESGNIKFHFEKVNLTELIAGVIDYLSESIKNKSINITIDILPELSFIYLDKTYFKQVLYNYLSNAIKYTANNGSIWIRVKPENNKAFRLEVQDTGIGIKAEDIGKLFVKFQQLDSSFRKKYAGIGVGLAIVKRIVEAQGGEVGVESVLGAGSTFYAILPNPAKS